MKVISFGNLLQTHCNNCIYLVMTQSVLVGVGGLIVSDVSLVLSQVFVLLQHKNRIARKVRLESQSSNLPSNY